MEGDWGTVDELLFEIRRLGVDNAWIREIEKELQKLARRRDQAMFAKEARYSARRMRTRLASPSESSSHLDAAGPAFLDRKAAQGKRRPRRPQPRH